MPEFDPKYQHEKIPAPSENPSVDSDTLIESLRAANALCVERTGPLITMLGQCRQQFQLYGENHKAKGTDDGKQKAQVNFSLVNQIDDVLRVFRERKEPEAGKTDS